MEAGRISIIIPTWNEADNLPQTLAAVQIGQNLEIIVVDGGSTDQTVAVARSQGVQVLSSLPGRAKQMNLGANAATGEILLFLHGDTTLPPGFDRQVRVSLAQPGVIAGAFALKIAGTLRGRSVIETLVNWRSCFWQMPYGDQAIFLRADTFQQMGQFPDMPIMEDFELMRRLRRRGRIAIVPTPVRTSDRRWRKLGILRTTLINQAIVLAYYGGVSPTQLVKWYRRDRR